MKVCLPIESLSRSGSGAITGTIYLSDGNFSFPSADWDDFVLVILDWWLEALATPLLPGAAKKCLFMDGDFAFRVSSHSADEWLVSCGNRADEHGTKQHVSMVNASEFWASLKNAADEVLEACQNRGWRSDDIDQLAQRCLLAAQSRRHP